MTRLPISIIYTNSGSSASAAATVINIINHKTTHSVIGGWLGGGAHDRAHDRAHDPAHDRALAGTVQGGSLEGGLTPLGEFFLFSWSQTETSKHHRQLSLKSQVNYEHAGLIWRAASSSRKP